LLLGWIGRDLRAAPALAAPAATAAPAPASEETGPGRYVLLSRLGGGGMAEIHLAVALGQRGFRRPCVVKRLRPELAANPAAVAQFTDEATLASSLVHANIVPIFDFAKVGNDLLLVEEYIVGRDLGRLVRRAGTAGRSLSPALVAYVGVEALKALEYAHAKRDHDGLPMGIVHRDVSPENIMVTARGEVQLLDFGVMKLDYGRGRTEIGELKGNLTFMAPEQARGQDVDARADLFALGSVLFFCLRGEPLNGQETGYDLLVKAASGPGPDELAKIAALPAPFDQVLGRALSPRREDRFADAAEFSQALRAQAPATGADIGALVMELFGEELSQEQQPLSASSVSLKSLSALTPTPGRPVRGDLGR
jgi:serine/threonine-protein kinase